MIIRTVTLVAACILAAILFSSTATAQFTQSAGTVVSSTPSITTQPVFTADGAGGVIVVWVDDSVGNDNIYAQRLDDHGVELWTAGGIPTCTATGDQDRPKVVTDGAGGAIITWQDSRDAGSGVYAQRLDADGQKLWYTNGVQVAVGTPVQTNHRTVADGYGGAIVVWEEVGATYFEIRAQRLAADGTRPWVTPVVAAATTGNTRYPELVLVPGASEADTRVTIAWTDYRNSITNGSDIYAQSLSLAGVRQWTSDGLVVYAGPADQSRPDLVASDAGGTIFCWWDERNASDWGYCQKLDRYGARQWTSTGISLASLSQYDQVGPRLAGDGMSGVYAVSGEYLCRIDQAGTKLWNRSIPSLVSEPAYNARPVLVPGGDCVVVHPQYGEPPAQQAIYGHKYDRDTGDQLWPTYGKLFANYTTVVTPPEALCTGDAVYITWFGAYWVGVIQVQRIETETGYWGYPVPVITLVADVPEDEGGWLKLTVRATTNDTERTDVDPAIGYNVWRRVPAGAIAKSTTDDEFLAALAAGEETAGMQVATPAASLIGLPAGDWESLGMYAAMQEPYYDFIVPTHTDAVGADEPWEVFVVSVHTSSPRYHFTSAPDSAYSVDNLAPDLIQGLAGAASYEPSGLALTWLASPESDLSSYRIHRSSLPDFTPDKTNFIAAVSAPTWFDAAWTVAAGWHYRIGAMDRHGNVEHYALLSPSEVTGVVPDGAPRKIMLAQNHPNPFNPATTIAFELVRATLVSLRVYDSSGRLVDVLLNTEEVSAGRNEFVWRGRDADGREVAAGVYFYRLEAGDFSETKRMVLVR